MSLKDLAVLGIIGISIKILLFPAYHSTDFDVHHNWLRITHQKPIKQWYYDDQNKWTLDYPPFFAYFEWFLSKIAHQIDPLINTFDTSSFQARLYFQRATVVLTQIPFLLIIYLIFNRKVGFSMVFSYLFCPFILLDNIHFQYNMMLQTLFLASVYFLVRKQNYLLAALTYSILLNFKHIYLYCSMAFFVIILRNYVVRTNTDLLSKLGRLALVGSVTLLPFVCSFGPFILMGGADMLRQIGSRLFPFGRGLIHDYWAPNFWALYYFLDKIIFFFARKVLPKAALQQISTATSNFASVSVSIINQTQTTSSLNYLRILPQPSANFTLLIILVLTIPLVCKVYRNSRNKRQNNNHNSEMINLIVTCGLIFFSFGYHVHEKAITPYLHLIYVFQMSQGCRAISNSLDNKEFLNSKSQEGVKQPLRHQEEEEQSKPFLTNKKQDSLRKPATRAQATPVAAVTAPTPNKNIDNVVLSNFQQLFNGSFIRENQIYGLVFLNMINLFPLLIRPQQTVLKIVMSLTYLSVWMAITEKNRQKMQFNEIVMIWLGLAIVGIGECINFNFLPVLKRFEFLPLLINSVACASVNMLFMLKLCITTWKMYTPNKGN